MTCSVRILSTTSVDSSPAILLVAANGNKTLVNCGEGCQRIFLEFGQKISTVNRVCLTHLSHSTLAGLPGMILTSADVISASAVSSAKQKAEANNLLATKAPKRLMSTSDDRPGLDLVGPKGIDAFVNSLRHFMRRESFEIRVHVGEYFQTEKAKNSNKPKRRKVSQGDNQCNEEDFHVQSIGCDLGGGRQAMSYIFTTPPVQGKFLVDKAKKLGIPPGPLYGQLKAGKDVKFINPTTGKEQMVESNEVVEEGISGVAVAILYYSSLQILEELQCSEALSKLLPHNLQVGSDSATIELIIHVTSKALFMSTQSTEWRQHLGQAVEHIFLDTDMPKCAEDDPGTPFHSASVGASCRSKLSSDIFVTPLSASDNEVNLEPHTTKAVPLLEYTIIPRSKKGFHSQRKNAQHRKDVEKLMFDLVETSGAIDMATHVAPCEGEAADCGEIIFTGTGSAIPCKHRNVSGIYLQMANGKAILLDAGEGTIGQLIRAKHKEDRIEIMRSIRAVWISHPHADHHLGLLRLLAERKVSLHGQEEPVVIIAPTNLKYFLQEYELIDPQIVDSYLFLDCQDVSTKAKPFGLTPEQKEKIRTTKDRLRIELGITRIQAIPVHHCAHSYAVELRGTSFGTVAYSGDCRPSHNFAEASLNADLLIHEATFSDGMEADAALKRHSTVGEALEIASRMKAKSVVLTHFSQRFPKIPPVSRHSDSVSASEIPVIFAFDYMKLTQRNLNAASKITPALRLLYPEDSTFEREDGIGIEERTSSDVLAIPGLFAQRELL